MTPPSPDTHGKDPSRLLLVLGVQRSGTTLLAAMLGRHSEINMLFESTTKDAERLIGKRYRGNKLLTGRQIHPTRRASKFGHLVNRLANLDLNPFRPRYHFRRPFPLSSLSIADYLERDALVVGIERREQDVVSSIVARTPMSERQAKREYAAGMGQIKQLGDKVLWVSYDELVTDPRATLERVCEALDLPFEESMLQGPRFNIVYPQDRVAAEKASTRREA